MKDIPDFRKPIIRLMIVSMHCWQIKSKEDWYSSKQKGAGCVAPAEEVTLDVPSDSISIMEVVGR